MVDPVELALVEMLVQLRGERARGFQVVAERLLDDDASVRGEPGVRQAFHDRAEQERRDLEVEDRAARIFEPLREALERAGSAKSPAR